MNWSARRAMLRMITVLACVGGASAVVPSCALATLWVSSNGTDTGYCSQANPCATLSRAISLAIPDDTIYIGPGVFHDHVTIPASISGLVLQGAGMYATTVTGGGDGAGSVFTIQADATVTISDMSITGGVAADGGGINSAGRLTLERDEVAFNRATEAGGGIYSAAAYDGGPPGERLTVSDSAIEFNQAGLAGGGVESSDVEGATLSRDLIEGNRVIATAGQVGQGGGVWIDIGTLNEDTIVGNQMVDGSGNPIGLGGGVYGGDDNKLTSDTIAGNTAAEDPGAGGWIMLAGTILADPCTTPHTDAGGNVFASASCASGGSSVVADPMLGPLQDNGGPTATMAIPTSSPAYDANTNCAGTDQRGVSNLQRGAARCDAGAYQVSAPTTYVANPPTGSVTAYATGAAGDAAPVLTLSGPNTGLSSPTGVVADTDGDVFVANAASNSITEYAPEVTGDVAPTATIAGPQTRLSRPQDLALDASGRLYVTNLSGAITEYAPGAHGNVAPVARIAGRRTLLHQPHGIVIDSDGNLRVTNANGTIDTFAANASGNVAPISRVRGDALGDLQGLNFDPAGHMVVADSGLHRVDTFAAPATGSAQLLSTLTGTPALQSPTGLDLDQAGDIFVADTTADGVLEYPPGGSGAAAPLASISGQDTGLSAPAFLSELPPTPAPRLHAWTRKRQTRRQILARGIVVRLRAKGGMAFRGAPVRVSAVARVRRTRIATARATSLRPGATTLTLIQTTRTARALRRHHRTTIAVTITLRDGAGTQRRQLTITCGG